MGSVRDLRPVFTTRDGIELSLPGRQQIGAIANAVALLIAAFIALYAGSQWDVWLSWRNAVPFGVADPVLGRDVGFYVFTLPFLSFIHGLGQAFVITAAAGAALIY